MFDLLRVFCSSVSTLRRCCNILYQLKNVILLSIILSRRCSFLPCGRCYFSLPFLSSSWPKMWTLSAESELLSMGHYVYSYTQRAASTSRSPTLSFSSRVRESTNTIDAIKYSGAKQGEINVGPGNIMDAGYNKTHLTAFNIYPSTRLCMHVVYILAAAHSR